MSADKSRNLETGTDILLQTFGLYPLIILKSEYPAREFPSP